MCKCNKCNKTKSNCNSNCEWCSYSPTTRQSCLPTPCVTGCLEIIPFSCVEADVNYPDLGLLKGAKLDSIITALIQLAQEGGVMAEQNFAFKTMTISEESINSDRINNIDLEINNIKSADLVQDNSIQELNSKIDELNTLDDLQHINTEIVFNIGDNIIKAEIDIEKLLDKLISSTEGSTLLASKFRQLVQYTENPENYSLAPHEVELIPSRTSILVKWSNVDYVMGYNVYHKEQGSSNYTKSTITPNLGYTIPGLTPNTTYEVYVTAKNSVGIESGPSQIIKTKTSL